MPRLRRGTTCAGKRRTTSGSHAWRMRTVYALSMPTSSSHGLTAVRKAFSAASSLLTLLLFDMNEINNIKKWRFASFPVVSSSTPTYLLVCLSGTRPSVLWNVPSTAGSRIDWANECKNWLFVMEIGYKCHIMLMFKLCTLTFCCSTIAPFVRSFAHDCSTGTGAGVHTARCLGETTGTNGSWRKHLGRSYRINVVTRGGVEREKVSPLH